MLYLLHFIHKLQIDRYISIDSVRIIKDAKQLQDFNVQDEREFGLTYLKREMQIAFAALLKLEFQF